MDEVRIVRRRTHIWPIVIAVVILAIVVAFVLFVNSTGDNTLGWNRMMDWSVEAVAGTLT